MSSVLFFQLHPTYTREGIRLQDNSKYNRNKEASDTADTGK